VRRLLLPALLGILVALMGVAYSVVIKGAMPSAVWVALLGVSLLALAFAVGARWARFKERDPEMAHLVGQAVLWAPTVYLGARAVHHVIHHED
jgi:hypothetical protein